MFFRRNLFFLLEFNEKFTSCTKVTYNFFPLCVEFFKPFVSKLLFRRDFFELGGSSDLVAVILTRGVQQGERIERYRIP